MNSSLKTINSQLSPLRYFKDNKLISKLYFNLDLKFLSPHIQQKKTLIDSILEKYQITKTYQKVIPQQKINRKSLPDFMEISLKNINETQKNMLSNQLNQIGVKMQICPPIQVPWFPNKISDINLVGQTIFKEQHPQNQDHPQFTDPVYRKRRDEITQIARNYKIQDKIPNVDYTKEQNQLWKLILKQLRPLHKNYFCQRFEYQLSKLNEKFEIENKIPQLSQLSQYLNQKSGWRIKPVHGIISQRQFLNSLAFKVFLSTQYLRHHATPFYTPEPDIVHEIIGHVPMFADKDIAELSQKIGLISLGASDQEIKKLGTIYFFTIQFGVCKQKGERRAYGAGFASCIKEIENMIKPSTRFKNFEPKIDCMNTFSTQQLQPIYYTTDSFQDALKEIQSYGNKVDKPYKTWYNQKTKSIEYDRNIQTLSY